MWPSGHQRWQRDSRPGVGVAGPGAVGGRPGVHRRVGTVARGRPGGGGPAGGGGQAGADFAKATGRLAKTDALDARVLAHFAEVRPPVRPLPDSDTRELHSLTARRNQVVEMLVAEKNRLGRAGGAVAPRIRAHIGWSRSWTTWTKACSRRCAAVRCGGSRTICCAPFVLSLSKGPWARSWSDRPEGPEKRLRRESPRSGPSTWAHW